MVTKRTVSGNTLSVGNVEALVLTDVIVSVVWRSMRRPTA